MKLQSVLIVEDSEEDQFLNSMIIQEYDPDISVHQAYNGQEALDMLSSGLIVDLILLDINMPLLDGFGFLEGYTSHPDLSPGAVVVMLTSSAQTGDIQKSRKYPCVKNYVLKPLNVQMLRNLADSLP